MLLLLAIPKSSWYSNARILREVWKRGIDRSSCDAWLAHTGYSWPLAAYYIYIPYFKGFAAANSVGWTLYRWMCVCIYVWPRYSTSGWLYIVSDFSLLFASSARTAMASVYSMYAHSYCCWCCCAHSVLVMWIALWPQCMLGGKPIPHARAVCADIAINLYTLWKHAYVLFQSWSMTQSSGALLCVASDYTYCVV